MRSSVQILTFLLPVLAFGSCIYPRTPHLETRSGSGGHRFGYDGETGPLGWHHLSSKNHLCKEGKHQSPINIIPSNTTDIGHSAKIVFDYPENAQNVRVKSDGHGINFHPEGSGYGGKYKAKINGEDYYLAQFHFHTPSEHRFNDEYFPLEVHFVHKDAETGSKLAVVGIFFDLVDSGSGSSFLVSLQEGAKAAHKSEFHTANITRIDLQPIQDYVSNNTPYSYAGSLTTPPCAEGVSWYVYEHPLEMVVSQFGMWKKAMKFNSRYTQNKPGRENLVEYAGRDHGEAGYSRK